MYFSWLEWLIVAAIVAIIGSIGYGAWKDHNTPTFELRKGEWVCMQHKTVPMTTFVMAGKAMVPITTYTDRCNQWNRK